MVKLADLDAKLWRESPESCKHMTVYGKLEMTTFICKVCGETGYLSEAYKESTSKRKNGSDMRPYHASCYIKTNGKYLKDPEKSTASLFEFLKD